MNSDPARVLLIGLGPTSLSALEGLHERFDVVGLVRAGPDGTTARADQLGVGVIDDTSVHGVRRAVRDTEPDAVVVSSYDRILDASLIENRPFVNVHYAPLPRGRGRATVNWAIINGDDAAFISIHHLVAALDAGGILYQGSVPITSESTVTMLYEALDDLQRGHIADAVDAAIAGDEGRPQVESDATYLCTRLPRDGEIDWSATTVEIDRLIRALQPPYPHAFTWLDLDRIDVLAAETPTDVPVFEGRIPGRVASVDRARGSVDVLTGDGTLRLHRVCVEGDEPARAADAITSVKTTLGLSHQALVDRIRTLLPPDDPSR